MYNVGHGKVNHSWLHLPQYRRSFKADAVLFAIYCSFLVLDWILSTTLAWWRLLLFKVKLLFPSPFLSSKKGPTEFLTPPPQFYQKNWPILSTELAPKFDKLQEISLYTLHNQDSGASRDVQVHCLLASDLSVSEIQNLGLVVRNTCAALKCKRSKIYL